MKKVLRLTESDLTKIVNRVINESVDYYDKIVNILEPPYFKNLRSIGIDEDYWETIFSKFYNQSVDVYSDSLYDENGNEIYHETSEGFWYKWEYDDNGNEIYLENSKGFWCKYEYNSSGNVDYYENSFGEIIDKRNNNLNESTDYYNKLLNVLQPPYFSNLRTMGFGEDEIKDILEKIFNEELVIEETSGTMWVSNLNDKELYYEDKWRNDYWFIKQYNDNGKITNYNNSDGFWSKYEYDDNGNNIYYENSDGDWMKEEFNENNDLIYGEYSDGTIEDNRNNNY
jgi:YD repeat-containing protein